MKITESKIKEFIQRCYDEKGHNRQSLMNDVAFKINRGMHSPAEAEILPHVYNYPQNNQ